MRFYLLLVLIATLADCHTTGSVSPHAEQTETALIFENGLAYDGCAEHIRLLSDSLLYRPTAASLPVLQQALTDIPRQAGNTERVVTIRFVKTGQQATLECGWGRKTLVGELNVLEIRKR